MIHANGPWKFYGHLNRVHATVLHHCQWTSEGGAQIGGFGLLRCSHKECTNVMLYQVAR